MYTTEEKTTARAYELLEGGWEVYYSDMPVDIPEYVQEDMFPFFLDWVRSNPNENIIEIIVYPMTDEPRKNMSSCACDEDGDCDDLVSWTRP